MKIKKKTNFKMKANKIINQKVKKNKIKKKKIDIFYCQNKTNM